MYHLESSLFYCYSIDMKKVMSYSKSFKISLYLLLLILIGLRFDQTEFIFYGVPLLAMYLQGKRDYRFGYLVLIPIVYIITILPWILYGLTESFSIRDIPDILFICLPFVVLVRTILFWIKDRRTRSNPPPPQTTWSNKILAGPFLVKILMYSFFGISFPLP